MQDLLPGGYCNIAEVTNHWKQKSPLKCSYKLNKTEV